MKMEKFGFYLLCVLALISSTFLFWKFQSGWFFLLLLYPFFFLSEEKKKKKKGTKHEEDNYRRY